MTAYSWPSGEEHSAERLRAAWPDTARRLPIGARVTGRVVGRQPFGVFVNIDGVPDALGLAEITAFPPGTELPGLGAPIVAEMIWHTEHHHQVRLRPMAEEA